jgi:hypothetical protein
LGTVLGNAELLHLAGYEGIICGLAAIYTGLAQIFNEVYGRVVWPIGPIKNGNLEKRLHTLNDIARLTIKRAIFFI